MHAQINALRCEGHSAGADCLQLRLTAGVGHHLTPSSTERVSMKIVSFSLEQGNKYFGKIDGTRFFIGSRVSFEGGKGLMNVSGTSAQKYDRAAFRPIYG